MNTLAKHNESFKNALSALGFTSRFDGMHYTKDNIAITKVFNRYVVGNIKGESTEPRTFISKEELEQDIKDFEVNIKLNERLHNES
mgnify:CR=1 FL=1